MRQAIRSDFVPKDAQKPASEFILGGKPPAHAANISGTFAVSGGPGILSASGTTPTPGAFPAKTCLRNIPSA